MSWVRAGGCTDGESRRIGLRSTCGRKQAEQEERRGHAKNCSSLNQISCIQFNPVWQHVATLVFCDFKNEGVSHGLPRLTPVHVRYELTLLNFVFARLPTADTEARQTTTINASITAYSTAVGPSSDVRKRPMLDFNLLSISNLKRFCSKLKKCFESFLGTKLVQKLNSSSSH